MPPKLPSAQTSPTPSQATPTHRPPEVAYHQSQRATTTARDDDAVPYNPGDENTGSGGGGGGGGFRKREDFAPLPADDHTFLGYVNQIMPWDWATTVTLRVLRNWEADEDGKDGRWTETEKDREIDWAQKPSERMSEKAQKFQRGLMFAAYAHGGWPVAPDEATGWPGWENSSAKGPDGKPYPLPPYDRFFVHRVDDRLVVPVVLEFTVRVDAGYETFPKVIAMEQYRHEPAGRILQAPQPYKVVDWVARQYGWDGAESLVNRCRRPVVALAKDVIRKNAGGLTWWWDALKPDRKRPVDGGRPTGTSDDIPF